MLSRIESLRVGASLVAGQGIRLLAAVLAVKLLAVSFGPDGMGHLGHVMSLVSILNTLSVGGIALGATRFIAQAHVNDSQIPDVLRTILVLGFGCALVVALLLFACAPIISREIVAVGSIADAVRMGAVVVPMIAAAILFPAIMTGVGDTKWFAATQAVGAVVGLLMLCLMVNFFAFDGAVLGLFLMASGPALLGIIWFVRYVRAKGISIFSTARKLINGAMASLLFRYSLMAIVAVCTMGIAQIVIRSLIGNGHGWQEAGLWQCAVRISDAYMQLITVYLAAHVLRQFVQSGTVKREFEVMAQTWSVLVPFFLCCALSVYFCRNILIHMLFSPAFAKSADLLIPQMIGDCLKLVAYVPNYLVVARGNLKLYALGEVVQSTLLVGLSALFIPSAGARGAVLAYALAYGIYLLLAAIALRNYWLSQSKTK